MLLLLLLLLIDECGECADGAGPALLQRRVHIGGAAFAQRRVGGKEEARVGGEERPRHVCARGINIR